AVPEAAGEYETLKKQLAEKYAFDRPSYTMGKEKLIKRLLAEAAQWEKTI
ncbi:MAG: GrpB family protein, partial [Clostridia bacterium]|nr:GrpB family protein [Clostridia bacterium]